MKNNHSCIYKKHHLWGNLIQVHTMIPFINQESLFVILMVKVLLNTTVWNRNYDQ